MNFDFDKIDTEKTFTVYDDGAHRVKCNSIEETVANSGNDQLLVKCEFVGGTHDGKKVNDYITLVASCDWKVARFIKSYGIDVKKLGNMDSKSGDFRKLLNTLIGKTSVWVIGHETGQNGKLRNTFDYEVDPDAAAPADDAPDFVAKDGEDQPPVAWDE